MNDLIQTLARELDAAPEHVENVVRLIDEGATIPFIARYRKELHGSMDDQLLRRLADRLQYLRGLAARKEEVRAAVEGQGKLTEDLSAALDAAATLADSTSPRNWPRVSFFFLLRFAANAIPLSLFYARPFSHSIRVSLIISSKSSPRKAAAERQRVMRLRKISK